MKGVWTNIEYKDEWVDQNLSFSDPKALRPTLYIWARDEEGKKHRLEVKGFKPYFFVPEWFVTNPLLNVDEIEKKVTETWNGGNVIKVYTYVPKQVKKLRTMIQASYAQAVVKEGDVIFVLRYLIDKKIRGSIEWEEAGEPRPCQEEFYVPPRKVYLDSELMSTRLNKGGAMRASEFVLCMTAYDSYDKEYHTWYVSNNFIEMPKIEGWIIEWCHTSREMITSFFSYIAEKDPDVITGYNVDFDLLNLHQESRRRDAVKEFDQMSALADKNYTVEKVRKKHRIRGVDWTRFGIIIPGREVIDMLDLIRMVSRTQLPEYTLEYVAKKFIGPGEEKLKYKGKPIAKLIPQLWDQYPKLVLDYNKHDVELLVKLDEKNDLINFLDTLRKTVGVRLGDAFSNQRMIDTEALRRRTYPLPSKFTNKKNEKDSYKGAFVVEPQPGVHHWVVCLDWRSLYPTIIRTFNIDTDTYISHDRNMPSEAFLLESPDGSKKWIFRKQPRGLFPQMLDDFTKLRDEYRRNYDKETDMWKKKILDTKQEAIKILSNAVYGTFGYRSRKHSLECAEAITLTGQKVLLFGAKIAEELGYKVIYGDTDSLFVATGKNNFGEAYNAGLQVQDVIMARLHEILEPLGWTSRNHLFYINMEKVYDNFFLVTKKRYAGRILEKDGSRKVDVKGLDSKRSDTSNFAGSLQAKVLTTLVSGNDLQSVPSLIAEEINKLGSLPYEEIGTPSAISKNLAGYSGNPIQKRAAENSNKYLNADFKYGAKPRRVYIKVPTPESVWPRKSRQTEEEIKEQVEELKGLYVIAVDEETVVPGWVKVDYLKTIDKTIKPKLERILEAIGQPWNKVEELLKQEYRPVKKERKGKRKQGALDKFLEEKKC